MKPVGYFGLAAAGLLGAALARSFLRPAKVIYGCEGRGDGGDPYLTRRTLLALGPLGKVNLHTFHRSDHDTLHDHPWPFVTLVLGGGYCDVTEGGRRVPAAGRGAIQARPPRASGGATGTLGAGGRLLAPGDDSGLGRPRRPGVGLPPAGRVDAMARLFRADGV